MKILLAFGADVNVHNTCCKTPLDLVTSVPFFYRQDTTQSIVRISLINSTGHRGLEESDSAFELRGSPSTVQNSSVKQEAALTGIVEPHQMNAEEIAQLLTCVGAYSSDDAKFLKPSPAVPNFVDLLDEKISQLTTLYGDLYHSIYQRLGNTSMSLTDYPDAAMSLATQLQEMTMYQKAGSRMLFLDGGGIRGLIQIEILRQIEEKTGRKITELFDWIVGSSTGGVVALALVYGGLSPLIICLA